MQEVMAEEPRGEAADPCYVVAPMNEPGSDTDAAASVTRVADRVGATASFLCAVHCALLPLLVAVLPAIGLGFLADHGFERGFVVFAVILAFSTMIAGFRRHHHLRAFWFLIPGVLLLLTGVVIDPHHAGALHAVLLASGGTLVALAHLINLRLGHGGHVHDAYCRH